MNKELSKIIEKKANKYAKKVAGVVVPETLITYTIEELNNFSAIDFKKGAEFICKWNSSKIKNIPINKILLCKVEDYYIIGYFDGSKWINDSSLKVENVTHWRFIF